MNKKIKKRKLEVAVVIIAMICALIMPSNVSAAIMPLTYVIEVGQKITIKAKNATFKSSNKKVATVTKKGVVTGRKKGTAKITVKNKNKKITVKVTVKKVMTLITAMPTNTPTPVPIPTQISKPIARRPIINWPVTGPAIEPTEPNYFSIKLIFEGTGTGSISIGIGKSVMQIKSDTVILLQEGEYDFSIKEDEGSVLVFEEITGNGNFLSEDGKLKIKKNTELKLIFNKLPVPTAPAPTVPTPTEPAVPTPTAPAPAPTVPTPTEPAPTAPAPTEPAPTPSTAPTPPSVKPGQEPDNGEEEETPTNPGGSSGSTVPDVKPGGEPDDGEEEETPTNPGGTRQS